MRRLATLCALATLVACASSSSGQHDEPSPSAEPTSEPLAQLSPSPESAVRKTVDCSAREEIIFSCSVPGGKHLAVCAPKTGEAEYRFGGDAPELELTGGKWANAMYSGGGEAQIRFSNRGTDYIVFSRMIRTNFTEGEPNYPAISDGVLIRRGGKFVALKLCEGGQALMPVQYDAARRAFGEAEDLFTDETIRADPEWARD